MNQSNKNVDIPKKKTRKEDISFLLGNYTKNSVDTDTRRKSLFDKPKKKRYKNPFSRWV